MTDEDPRKKAHIEVIEEALRNGFAYTILNEESDCRWTRVANNIVSEHAFTGGTLTFAMAMQGGKIGFADMNGTEKHEELRYRTIRNAIEEAKLSVDAPWVWRFPTFPSKHFARAQHYLPPKEREHAIIPLIERVNEEEGVVLSGTLMSNDWKAILGSSRGRDTITWQGSQICAAMSLSDTDFKNEVALTAVGSTLKELNLKSKLEVALRDLDFLRERPYREIPAGQYDVLFAPSATGPLMEYVAESMLSGRYASIGGGFPLERVGTQVCSPNVTLRDEPFNPLHTYMVPCDTFGVLKAPVTTFIERGVLKGFWYDTPGAYSLGAEPTGHGQEISFGPHNLHLTGGDGPSTEESAVRRLKNGILVSCTDYNRQDSSPDTAYTGFTRYGTYLVERGAIVARLGNLRFLDSPTRMLNAIEWMSKRESVVTTGEEYGPVPRHTLIVPNYIKLNGLNIIGSTPMEMQR